MPPQWFRAQDTFAAELEDGSHMTVTKGDTLQASHELVKRDIAARKKDGGTPLFAPLESEPEKPRTVK